MDDVIELYGQAALAAIATSAIIGLASWFVFGDPSQNGTLSAFIYETLNSILQ